MPFPTDLNVTKLDLSGQDVTIDNLRRVAAAPSLTTLSIGGNVEDEGIHALVTSTSLTSLEVTSFPWFGPAGFQDLANFTRLRSLSITEYGGEGIAGKILSTSQSLTALTLTRSWIRDEEAEALAQCTSLVSLNLCTNEIGDKGAIALSRATRLTSLNIQFNGIGDTGAKALVATTHLKALGLAFNPISDKGAQEMAHILKGNNSLEHLFILQHRKRFIGVVRHRNNLIRKEQLIQQLASDPSSLLSDLDQYLIQDLVDMFHVPRLVVT